MNKYTVSITEIIHRYKEVVVEAESKAEVKQFRHYLEDVTEQCGEKIIDSDTYIFLETHEKASHRIINGELVLIEQDSTNV